MTNTLILLSCIMIPCMIFGYCIRWMIEEDAIAKKLASNKQKLEPNKVLPPL